MKSKMSFFNAGIIKQDFKQHGWVSIVYFVGLLLALPLQIMTMRQYYGNYDIIWSNLEFQASFLFTVPVFAGMILFRYLQSKDAADMMHSLPVHRKNLYVNHFFSGLLMLLPPILLTAISTWIVCQALPPMFMLNVSDIFSWIGIMTLLTIFLFSLSVAVGMITGMSTAQGVLTYIFLLLPVGLLMLVSYQLRIFLYGFSDAYMTKQEMDRLSPFIRFMNIKTEPFTVSEVFVYILLIFIFFIVGFLLYKNRHLEHANNTIAFQLLKPVFKYGVTFSAMLLSSAYFTSSQNDHIVWIIFGYTFGAIVGYIVAESILQKTWRIFQPKMLLGFAGYAIVIAFLFWGMQADIIGYQTKVPDINQIQGVFFGHSVYEMKEEKQINQPVFSDNASYILAVRAMHEQTIAKRTENENSALDFKLNIVIAYLMKNGKTMLREYRVPYELVENELAPVMETDIYKYKRYELHLLDKPIEKITFHPTEPVKKRLVIVDPAEIAELKEILIQEILSSSYEDMTDTRADWSTIAISFPSDEDLHKEPYTEQPYATTYAIQERHFEWKKSYQNIERWLKDKGYLPQSRINPEDIDYMEVIKSTVREQEQHFSSSVFEQLQNEIVKIEDKKMIGEALEQYSSSDSGQYYVRFTTVEGLQFFGAFTEENEPAFLSRFFQK